MRKSVLRLASIAALAVLASAIFGQSAQARYVYTTKRVCSPQRHCPNTYGTRQRCTVQRVCRTSYRSQRRCTRQRTCTTRYSTRRSCRPYRRCTTYRGYNGRYQRRCTTTSRCTSRRVPQRYCTTRNRCTAGRQPYRQCRNVRRCSQVRASARRCTVRNVCRIQRVRRWVPDRQPNYTRTRPTYRPNRPGRTSPSPTKTGRVFISRSQITNCTRHRSVAQKYGTSPGGFHAMVSNRCGVATKARACYLRLNNTWSCYTSSLSPGESRRLGFSVTSRRRYHVCARDARDRRGWSSRPGCS